VFTIKSAWPLVPELAERLGAAAPADRSRVDLATYHGIKPPWNDWKHLAERGRAWAKVVARLVMESGR
jgi:hypothetical protein